MDTLYWIDVHFFCPAGDFADNIYRLRRVAETNGLGFEVLVLRNFRNRQRFGAKSTEAMVRFSGYDKSHLKSIVRHIG